MNFNFSKFLYGEERTKSDIHRRISHANQYNDEHGEQIYNYFERGWMTGSSPIYMNSGIPERGLPISCYVNSMPDDLRGILSTLKECGMAASFGGGLGTYYGNVRPIGSPIGVKGTSGGIVPFMKMNESIIRGINQGSLRRGSGSTYLPIWHPEIESFIKIRKDELTDESLKTKTLHHGVCIDDKFMHAVLDDTDYTLHFNGTVSRSINARELWKTLLKMRLETGEPYIVFIDTVNHNKCENYKKLGMNISTSNLCSEILLHTGLDPWGKERSAVCCLSSVNLAKYDEWKHDDKFIYNVLLFLDGVLTNFLKYADKKEMRRFRYSVSRERSVGLSVMGLHTYCQAHNMVLGDNDSRNINLEMFKFIREHADIANEEIGALLGACPDSIDAGTRYRFSNMIALAPTFSVSHMVNVSPSIEPWISNVFSAEFIGNKFKVRNKELYDLLQSRGMSFEAIDKELLLNNGSVQNFSLLTDHEKEVFAIARELDQSRLVTLACDRAKYIDQGQSFNLFVGDDHTGQDVSDWHIQAWVGGLKSMYYVRSKPNNHETKTELVTNTVPISEEETKCQFTDQKIEEDPKVIAYKNLCKTLFGVEECQSCQ